MLISNKPLSTPFDSNSLGELESESLESDSVDNSNKSNWLLLKALQKTEPYKPVYLNRVRYRSMTMMPTYSNYSFEELRYAFQKNQTTRQNVRLEMRRVQTAKEFVLKKLSKV